MNGFQKRKGFRLERMCTSTFGETPPCIANPTNEVPPEVLLVRALMDSVVRACRLKFVFPGFPTVLISQYSPRASTVYDAPSIVVT